MTMLRLINSLSIRQAAKEIHISHQLLGFIESGRQPPTEEFIQKIEKINYSTELGLLLHKISKKGNLYTVFEVERFIYSLPEEFKKAVKINIFLCLQDIIKLNPERGHRIKESGQKDGLVIYSPVFAWFMGGNFNKIISGNEFIAFFSANPDHITTSQTIDFALYLFNEIGYNILDGKIKCKNNNKEYGFTWGQLSYRMQINPHPDYWKTNH